MDARFKAQLFNCRTRCHYYYYYYYYYYYLEHVLQHWSMLINRIFIRINKGLSHELRDEFDSGAIQRTYQEATSMPEQRTQLLKNEYIINIQSRRTFWRGSTTFIGTDAQPRPNLVVLGRGRPRLHGRQPATQKPTTTLSACLSIYNRL